VESVSWVSWVNGILGAWLVVSPLFMSTMMSVAWNSVILGLIVLGVAVWGAVGSSSSVGYGGHAKMH
jgi:uncharacterized membrane protein